MRLVIDARMLDHSGIGTYLANILPDVLERCAALDPVVLTLPDVLPRAAELASSSAVVLPWKAAPLSAAEWRSPPPAGAGDLWWVPHFNVPLRSNLPLVVTLHDLLPLSGVGGRWPLHKRLAVHGLACRHPAARAPRDLRVRIHPGRGDPARPPRRREDQRHSAGRRPRLGGRRETAPRRIDPLPALRWTGQTAQEPPAPVARLRGHRTDDPAPIDRGRQTHRPARRRCRCADARQAARAPRRAGGERAPGAVGRARVGRRAARSAVVVRGLRAAAARGHGRRHAGARRARRRAARSLR